MRPVDIDDIMLALERAKDVIHEFGPSITDPDSAKVAGHAEGLLIGTITRLQDFGLVVYPPRGT